MVHFQDESLAEARDNRLEEQTGELRWNFLLVSKQGLEDLCFWADDSHVVIQVFDVEFELSEEGKPLHDFAVVGDCLEGFAVCLFAEEHIDAVIDGLILEVIPNKRERFWREIINADAMRFWLLDQVDLGDVLDAQPSEVVEDGGKE